MEDLNKFPEVMRHAREDLSANVSGRFSPEDWQSILNMARSKFDQALQVGPRTELKAWEAVILDFYQNRYWGFVPDYKPAKDPSRPKNLGISLIIMVFMSMTVTKIAVAWFGQIYTRSDEPKDAYMFYLTIIVVLAGYGHFLWRTRNHQD